ncbi:aryl-alcohol dehydrogenase-like predicted oxidoreductase [Crossiella equi]|uniref:Aryl-alcohol dehydrogenase-like predicted oxidoreductase n=1 Tax=Crossiella equi TaxID=130796 RepID=A0ABS5A4P5_9PSEU|nr:aldo/keto reductase [Crossiella equi]MBP2471548.1 aryl-alcohol dehydrogenase-like predicted oxidoreductase [Crossiella equi]
MDTRSLGSTGPAVGALGLGCMGMSDLYGPADRAEGIRTIHAALDAGVTFLDTGDFYGMGHNELLIQEALRGRADRERAVLSVKFGALRDATGGWNGLDGRPAAVKNFAAYSLQRLGVDHLDVYRPARVDPDVPIEDTVGAIAELVEAGQVRHIGLSEVSAGTIRRAAAVHPIADVQIEYSLLSRGIEAEILPTCRELGIAITAYGVLGRGMLSGHWTAARALTADDFRAHSPRFAPENIEHNLGLVEVLRELGAARGATAGQVALAWVAAQGPDVLPLAGARTPAQLAESVGALSVRLTADELAHLDKTFHADAAAGPRAAEALLAHLDSEH